MNRWTQAGTLFVGIVPTDPSEITLGNLLELNLKHSLCHTFIIFKEVWRRDERQTAEIFRVWMLSFEINQPGDWGWDAAHFFQYFKLDSTTTHWRQSRKSDGKIILVSLVINSKVFQCILSALSHIHLIPFTDSFYVDWIDKRWYLWIQHMMSDLLKTCIPEGCPFLGSNTHT